MEQLNLPDEFSPEPEFGDHSPYSGSIEAIIKSSEFLANLESSIEVPGNKIMPDQIPGEKSICGTVRGNRFKIRKAGALANPMTRDLVGTIEDTKSGSVITYRLEQRPSVLFFQTSIMVAIICLGLFSTMIFLTSLRYISTGMVGMAGVFAVGGPLLLLILFLVFFSVFESTGASEQDELMDHVRKLAAGINVSS